MWQPTSTENGLKMVAFNQAQKRHCKISYLPAWCRLCCFSLWGLSFCSCFPSFLVSTLTSVPTAPGDTKIGTAGCTVKTEEKNPNHMLQPIASRNTTSLIPFFFLVGWLHKEFCTEFSWISHFCLFPFLFKYLHFLQCTLKNIEDHVASSPKLLNEVAVNWVKNKISC